MVRWGIKIISNCSETVFERHNLKKTSPDHGQVEHSNVVDSPGNIWMVRWGFYGQVWHQNHFNMIRDCIWKPQYEKNPTWPWSGGTFKWCWLCKKCMYGQVGFPWSGETSKSFQYEQRLYLKAIIWGKPSPDHGQVQNRKTFFVLLRGSWHNGQVRGWSAVLEMPKFFHSCHFFHSCQMKTVTIIWIQVHVIQCPQKSKVQPWPISHQ